MRYQNPQFLYFLFSIAIPIFIHLFNLRKHKVVYFTNVKFLKEIKSEKKKRNKLKEILILLSRILAISSIVFAFSNPYLPLSKKNTISKNTFIYIDNSFSMDDISEQGRLLDVAKEKGLKILDKSEKSNNFWVLTNDFNSSENFQKNKTEARKTILSIQTSSQIKTKEDILEKKKSINNQPSSLFLISDFQKSSTNINQFLLKDSSNRTILVPLEKELHNNISLDSCYLKTSINKTGNRSVISALVTNNSIVKKEDIIVTLNINNSNKTQQNISLLSGETKKINLNFVSDERRINNGVISIEDHPITYDNKLYFSFNIENNIKIFQIFEDENTNINKLFGKEENIEYTKQNTHQIDYDKLRDNNLIILNELFEFSSGLTTALNQFIEQGGSICIIPSKNMNTDSYNLFLQSLNTNLFTTNSEIYTKISDLNLKHPIFNNVFSSKKLREDINLSSVNYYYNLSKKSSVIKENIFKLENGDEFLNYYTKGKGEIYLFTAPLSSGSNFTKHALFVTTFYNMALHSIKTDEIYYNINKKSEIKLIKTNPEKENIYHIKSENQDIIADYIHQANTPYLSTHNQIKKDGHYQLTQENKLLNSISFNYSREESNTEQYKAAELESFIKVNNLENTSIFSSDKSITENMKKLDNTKEYWKLFILLALLFITLEILLIKTIKT